MPPLATLPSPVDFADLVERREQAAKRARGLVGRTEDPRFLALGTAEVADQKALRSALSELERRRSEVPPPTP